MSLPYAIIYSRIWHDRDIRRLSDSTRLLVHYLLENEYRTSEGYYEMPLDHALVDLGWTAAKFHKCMAEVSATGFAFFDEGTDQVLIVNALKYNRPRGPKQVTGAYNKVCSLPPSPLRIRFVEAARQWCEELFEEFQTKGWRFSTDSAVHSLNTHTLSEGYRKGSDTTENENENEYEIEKKGEGSGEGGKGKAFDARYLEVFTHWQQTLNHPRSRPNPSDEKVVVARIREGFTVDDLKTAVLGCSLSPHHMGQNDRHQRYDSLSLICRDGSKVNQFIGYSENGNGTADSEAVRAARILVKSGWSREQLMDRYRDVLPEGTIDQLLREGSKDG